MKASESFRRIQNSPVGYIARYYFDIYLKNIKEEEIINYVEEIKTGKTPSKSQARFYESQDFDWYKPDEIGKSLYLNDAKSKVSNFAVSSNQVTVYKPKTLLINCIGDIGRVGIILKEASSNQQITGILFKENVLPEYMFYYLLSHRNLLQADASSTTLPIINQKKLLTVPFKKPRLVEQQELVKLLSYAWESWENETEVNFSDFDFKSSLLEMCYRFFLIDLKQKELCDQIDQQQTYLQQLRQGILQEAVQGKLSEPGFTGLKDGKMNGSKKILSSLNLTNHGSDNNEDAATLLKRIKAEKGKLLKEGKLKREKELPPITEDEIPFELPKGWVWCRLGEVCIKIGSGSTPRGGREVYKNDGIKFIRSQNVYNDGLIFTNVAYIDRATHNKMTGTKVIANDILLNITGGSIGRSALVPENFDEANVNQHVTIIRTVSIVEREFIHLLIISPYFQDYIMQTQTGGNREGLAKKNMELMLIPLPPVIDQKKIVTKVQQFQQQLNQLESQVQQSREYAEQLLQAVLKEAFEEKGTAYIENEMVSMVAEE